jgi:hypothetical protein
MTTSSLSPPSAASAAANALMTSTPSPSQSPSPSSTSTSTSTSPTMAITVSSPSPPPLLSPLSNQSLSMLAPAGVPIVGMDTSIISPCSITSSWSTLSQTSIPFTPRLLEEMKYVVEWLDTKYDFNVPILNNALPAFGLVLSHTNLMTL